MIKHPQNILLVVLLLLTCHFTVLASEIELKITKRYLNFPISGQEARHKMTFQSEGQPELNIVIRLAAGEPDYWVFKDVSNLIGKTLTISYEGNQAGLSKIYQADEIAGADSLYQEQNRPQFHFTTRRGWINDPNGLLYYDGEYHLFYQHNPYEREWENMHWGHAVSNDLIHWKELPDALYPDELGTMFSGSAVIDDQNTAGWNSGSTPAMVAAYTAANRDRQTQGIAYSLDKGKTFTKYEGNPVIDSKEKWNSIDTRDPKVFWYEPGNHWVMVLNERDGHSIYNSSDLKNWEYQSHTTGFWECPELFELPVDGNTDEMHWVMYGASGTYMLGEFNGKTFTPTTGKHHYITGSIYAAQTFTNVPNGRRIQMGWGQISHPGMPFTGMMMLPTELTLRTTKDGPRLFNEPVKETENLFIPIGQWRDLTAEEANKILEAHSAKSTLRIRTRIKLSHATSAGISLSGQRILNYDLNYNKLNGAFYSPNDPTEMGISADIYIDKTSIEIFVDDGAFTVVMPRETVEKNNEHLRFWGNNISIQSLEILDVASIWK
ncbi:glycoside hydrolase family 32 protein [Echinicola vietnamensis]|uniref:Beta-fructosidase, levanase/invertase n=1 Tax=Echinicola vietnamensis (strain DSM 17526 / LMG 23754 / KMM 6221) TaxID=926556 RepID=L0G254_ECHVK|nr:glycoside hydrolase family 32 protein [Echinicola vietnamensis]AGA79046.1 beta-fructosidase, levanase/invertase [Echinicola vietnamensis DSM 17526]